MSGRSSKRRSSPETGALIVLLALALVGLVAGAGIVIDSGRLFLVHAQLQRAVDAGAATGVQLLSRRKPDFVKGAVRLQTETNLQEMGIEFDPLDIEIEVASASVDIRASINVPLILIGVLPGVGSFSEVHAHARGERPRLQVALVLDDTASMAGAPIENLRIAAANFIALLDREKDDRVSIIKFGNGASVLYSLGQPVENMGSAELLLSQLDASESSTCVGCGLLTALSEFEAHPDPTAIRAVILMSDGNTIAAPSGNYSFCGWEPLGDQESPWWVRQGLLLQLRGIANSIRLKGILINSVGLGVSPNFGPTRCQRNENAPSIARLPGPIDQDGDGLGECFWCTEPTPFNFSAEHYDSNSGQPGGGNRQWCGGTLKTQVLYEIANDITVIDPALIMPTAPDLSLPPQEDCHGSAEGLCGCYPLVGTEYPVGRALITADPSELTPMFEELLRYTTSRTRLVE